MPTDPSLILNAAQNFPQVIPDPTTLGNSQLTAAKLAQFNQQQQGVNALRDLYSNPDNLVNGKPTPEALQRLTASAPQTGLDLQRQLTQDQQGQVQLSLARAKEGDAVLRQKMIIAQEAQADYQENLKTMTPEQALATTQKNVWTPGRQQLAESGLVSPDALATMPPHFDPQRVGRSLSVWNEAMVTPQQRFEQSEKLKADARAEEDLTIKQQNEAINQQKANQAKAGGGGLEQSKTLEILDKDDNVVRTISAREKKGEAGWIDSDTGKPIQLNANEHTRQITPSQGGGGRAGAQIIRQQIGGREVLSDLQNVRLLPMGQTSGLLGAFAEKGTTVTDALHGDLVRTLNSQDAQFMQGSMAGVTRELSILMSPVYGGNYATKLLDPLTPKAGDTFSTVQFKMARIAQSADNALEALSKSQILSNDQKQYAKELQKSIDTAIPWNPEDAIEFAKGDNKKENFMEFVNKRHGKDVFKTNDAEPHPKENASQGNAAASPPPTQGNAAPLSPTGGIHHDATREQYDQLPPGALYTMPGSNQTFVKQ